MALASFNILFLLTLIIFMILLSFLFVKGKKKMTDGEVFMSRDYTTALKGVAILLIMACHCSGNWTGGRLLTPWGGIGVCIFLISSGYGLNESYRSKGLDRFWARRIGKVWFPYAIVTLALILFNGFHGWANLGLQLICVNSLYWFIPYIIECYIVFWLCSRFIPKYRMIVFLVVSMISLFLAPEIQAEQALSFITGVWISENKVLCRKRLSVNCSIWKFTSLFAGIGLVALSVKQLPFIRVYSDTLLFDVIQLLIKWPLGLAVVLGVGLVPSLIKNPFIILAGTISYELYLVHFPFYTMIGTRFWPAIILWIASFIVSWCFNKLNGRIGRLLG